MSYSIVRKDPSENLSVDIDWSDWLENESIATSTWTVPTGLTKDADLSTTTTTSIWLTGGTLRRHYSVVNSITTTSGRATKRTVIVRLVDK